MAVSPQVPILARSQHFVAGEDIAIVLHDVESSTGLHIHEFFEIVYLERGSVMHLYGPTRRRVEAGSLFIVNPSIPHGYEVDGDGARICNVVLTEQALSVLSLKPDTALLIGEITGHKRFSLDYLHIMLSEETNAQVRRIILEMDREFRRKKQGYQAILSGYLLTLAGMIVRAIEESGISAADRSPSQRKLGEVTRYIVENCHRPLSVERLAREHGWTPDHLNRLLRKSIGDTTQGFIGRVRAAKAAQLLLSDGITVDEAAKSVGYGDARALRRAFKRYYGVPPSEFRRLTL